MTTPVKPAEVVMYRTPFCPYCTRAELLLARKGVRVREVDVSRDEPTRRWLLDATKQRTVPQIFINGVSVGGYDDIAALDRRGILDQLLSEAPKPDGESLVR
ncbi:MAG TPA: glutaredoxin 3 [Polyangiaceae bacterium]|jgi:glutaredoxin 3|nr:glutaredoxin 3 [Polyangiaceae bacterium]